MASLQELRKEVRALPQGTVAASSKELSKDMEALQVALNQLQQQVQSNSNKSVRSSAASGKLTLSEAQLRQMLVILAAENTKLIQQAFQVATVEQQKQLEDALQNFAFYLKTIREEDMHAILTTLEELNQKTDIKSKETDQAIDALFQSLQSRNTQ